MNITDTGKIIRSAILKNDPNFKYTEMFTEKLHDHVKIMFWNSSPLIDPDIILEELQAELSKHVTVQNWNDEMQRSFAVFKIHD